MRPDKQHFGRLNALQNIQNIIDRKAQLRSKRAMPPKEPVEAHTSKAASVDGLGYPSLTTASVALDRIDFTAWLYRLHYHGESGAIARRTFLLNRLHGRLFHLTSL